LVGAEHLRDIEAPIVRDQRDSVHTATVFPASIPHWNVGLSNEMTIPSLSMTKSPDTGVCEPSLPRIVPE